MSDAIQKTLSGEPHQNNGLFSDYYLNEIVPTLDQWHDAFNEGRAIQEQLRDLRATIQPDTLDEAQLEQQWIQPVLNLLGHHYGVQVKVRYRENKHRKPDYLLMQTADDARALTNEIYDPAEIAHAVAVADAKKWGVNLDQTGQGQRNPSQQIDEYLRYSELSWGILTDGRIWRLYARESSKYNTYYAVDLDSLLNADTEQFLYFYAFFRQDAFTGDFLKRVLAGSEEFAQKLTDTLEDEVYDALELLAQGFLEYRRNRLDTKPDTLQMVYQQSLVLLYRLLFIFYAESREILPLNDNEDYTDFRSLRTIKRAVANKIDFPRGLNRDGSDFYTRLNDLFFLIDAGSPDYDLPPYNGRLFSPLEHPFLAEKVVGDAYLVPALDKLARVVDPNNRNGKRVFVDYRDLDVRHLGAIYEKLLEYELDIATEPMTTKGKDQRYVPAKSDDEVVKRVGQVFLRTGNNERKVTGSYYTPDYIVRFIVEKTLEPLLIEITERYADQDEQGQWQVRDADALVRDILSINVLDPATGSGHFVVDVTAYIAEWLRGLGLHVTDLGDEDELIYWKRQVASACIYAVDINPLAVELAKLSMWLTTLAKGKPLSFLDHHIRVGNTLVGASIFDISDDLDAEKRRKRREKAEQRAAETGQMAMFSDADFADGVRFAVAQMAEIEGTVADEVADVKRQEQLYADLTGRLSVWQQAADVWTARAFGLDITAEQWQAVREFTTSGMIPPAVKRIVEWAGEIAAEQRFFHWELAFPEIFFDAEGKPQDAPGFDAVVGNPPYVRQERIQPIKPFLQSHYAVYSGTADLFLYFYERGLEFVKDAHRLGYITSGTYMNSNSAKPFREYIHDHAGMEWVANFGENQPFRGAEMVYPTIAVVRHGKGDDTFQNLFMEGNVPYADLQNALESGAWVDSLSEATGMDEWRFQPAELTLLFSKISSLGTSLIDVVGNDLYRGVTTGLNDAFVVNESTRKALIEQDISSAEIVKSLCRGQDLRPWYKVETNEYLIFTRRGINIESYPAVKAYLEAFRTALEPRPSDWQGSWQGRKAGSYKWYEIQDQTAYYHEFDKPKIIWSDISKLPRFSWNDSGDYLNNTGFFISNASWHLLALLQSRILWFMLSQIATPLRLRAGLWQYRVLPQNVERLPIPELTAQQESDLAAIAEEITGLARSRYGLHESFRRTLINEFDGEDISTRVALYRWWEFADEKALSDEVKRRFGDDIPLKQRGDWRGFLAEQKAEHARLTDAIIALETRMNDIVYDAFDLTAEERRLIETTTKYPYGEV